MDVVQSKNYLVECRAGGTIIVNAKVLKHKGLEKATSYQDLLKTEYKRLISMPNPKSSGTGCIFLEGLVNTFVQGEVATGLGMTSQAVTQIN